MLASSYIENGKSYHTAVHDENIDEPVTDVVHLGTPSRNLLKPLGLGEHRIQV